MHDDLGHRKAEHLDLVARPEVEPEETDPLFSCVRLVHRALPELNLSDIALGAELCGGRLRAPFMITGMTGGDRDFTGQLDAIGRVAGELGERLVVKETGCGIGPEVVSELRERGVRAIDVSGAGGTSWTRVEQLRAQNDAARGLGQLLSDW